MPQEKPRYSHWKNGAVYDHAIGRIVANPGGGIAAFNSETGKRAVVIREEDKLQAIRDGIMEGAKMPSVGKGLQAIIASQVSIAKGDTSRSTDAARLIFQVADIMPDKQPSQPQAVGISEAALHDVRDMLAMVMQERARRDSVHDDDTVIDSTCVTLPDDASEQAGGDEDA
jgi:hypothetical protein